MTTPSNDSTRKASRARTRKVVQRANTQSARERKLTIYLSQEAWNRLVEVAASATHNSIDPTIPVRPVDIATRVLADRYGLNPATAPIEVMDTTDAVTTDLTTALDR